MKIRYYAVLLGDRNLKILHNNGHFIFSSDDMKKKLFFAHLRLFLFFVFSYLQLSLLQAVILFSRTLVFSLLKLVDLDYSKIMPKKRIDVPIAERKKYCELIRKGANHGTVSALYETKHKEPLSERTFYSWKKKLDVILGTTSKTKFRKREKTSAMERLEEKMKEEYRKRQIPLQVRGTTIMVKTIINEHFSNDPEIQALKLSTRLILRLMRDTGKRSSRKSDKMYLTAEEQEMEIQRLRSHRAKYPIT